MADQDEYAKKLASLQQYIPFLENMMGELKAKGNREAQLTKIKSLHDMITDKRKKLKLETLKRCEEVLTNIYIKVNPQLKTKPKIESPRLTPASPSPPRDVIPTKPVTIPTEKVAPTTPSSSSSATIVSRTKYPKIDVYGSALIGDLGVKKQPVVTKTLDMSKPPISLDDLKTLEDDVQSKITAAQFSNATVEELDDVRKRLEMEIRVDKVSTTMSASSSAPKSYKNPDTPPKATSKEKKSHKRDKEKPKKIIVHPDNTFGSLLSSLDQKLREDKRKKEKKSSKDDGRKTKSDNKEDRDKKKKIVLKRPEKSDPISGDDKKPSEDSEKTQTPYKRLADKYNPKPKKPPADDVDKIVKDSIEQNMKTSPVKIPLLPEPKPITEPIPPPASLVRLTMEKEPPKPAPPPAAAVNPLPEILQKIFTKTDPRRQPQAPPPPPPQPLLSSPVYNFNPRFPTCQLSTEPPIRPLMMPNHYHVPNFAHPQIDYYGANNFPPLLTPEVPHYVQETKPQFYPGWDRDRRSRDPRSYREYREMKEREAREVNQSLEVKDPRLIRDEQGTTTKDPRINRSREREYNRGASGGSRERSKSRTRDYDRPTRYDRIYAKTNARERSRQEDDAFASPLDSLYARDSNRTGKGYGMQNFRIPKKTTKKNPEDEDESDVEETKNEEKSRKTDEKEDQPVIDPKLANNQEKKEETEDKEAKKEKTQEKEAKKEETQGKEAKKEKTQEKEAKTEETQEKEAKKEETQEKEAKKEETQGKEAKKVETPEKEPKKEETPKEDDQKTVDIEHFVSEYDLEYQAEQKKKSEAIEAPPPANVSSEEATSTTTTLSEATSSKIQPEPTEQNILAHFFENLFKSKNKNDKKTALFSLIETFSDSFSDVELEKITKIIKTNEPEEKPATEEAPKPEAAPIPQEAVVGSTTEEFPKEEDKTPEEPVTMSVGERTKNRKRTPAPKSKKKMRTELDWLHEDIQEMFIRDGVLTATGKRMCRMLKDDPTALNASEETKKTKSKLKINPEEMKSMKSVRVLISKMPEPIVATKPDEQTPKRVLRSRAGRKSTLAESDDDLASDESETSEDEQDKSPKTKPVKRRRGKRWAAGIVNKKKKKSTVVKSKENTPEPEDNNASLEADLDKLFVEPDKNYFTDKQTKLTCKLCDHTGFSLAGHYLKEHPHSEVLCSRFSPAAALEAKKDYANKRKLYETSGNKKIARKYQYSCRICGYTSATTPIFFYEHVSTHTGEYRHRCGYCDFCAANGKSLSYHFLHVHPNEEKKSLRNPYTLPIIYGYMCGECNYVQLTEKNVEEHVNIYHLGEKPKIFKVNMSKVLDPDLDDVPAKKPIGKKPGPKSKTKIADDVSGEETPSPKVRKRNSLDKLISQQGEDLDSIIALSSRGRAAKEKATVKLKYLMENNDVAVKRKPPEQEVKTKTTEEVEIQPKREENVFTCSTDILQEESRKIEEERLRTMEELNKSIGSRQSKLDIVDKLCTRLNNELNAEVVVKEEPRPETPMPVLEKQTSLAKRPSSAPVEAPAPKKPLLDEDLPPTSINFQKDKTTCLFTNMIEKLQGKVNEASQSEEDSSVFIGGLVKATKTDDSVVYSCHADNCYVSTKDKLVFQLHCKFGHKDLTADEARLCDVCGVYVTATPDTTLMENLYDHLMYAHANFHETEPKFAKPNAILRARKLSGDKLSVKREPEPELTETEENPFSFKIAEVVSLAETTKTMSVAPPPLTPITTSPKQQSNNHVVMKEARLSQAELTRPRKAPKAMTKFVETPAELYKCPHYYCMFTTNFRAFLERHLKAHKTDVEVMIPCVYCDIKTPWEHVPMHIDIRHAHCRYACCYCLYRSWLKEYVCLHQDQAHAGLDYSVIQLPSHKSARKFAVSDYKLEPRVLCEAFVCVCKNREGKLETNQYLFENEFDNHLMTYHKNNFIPCSYKGCTHRVQGSLMTSHWALFHNVCTYQCGYCKMNTKDIVKMYQHFAQFHQWIQPEILIRQFNPLPVGKELGYTDEAFELLPRITALPNNVLSLGKPKGMKAIKMIHLKTTNGPNETDQPSAAPSNTLTLQQVDLLGNQNIKILMATSGNNILLVPAPPKDSTATLKTSTTTSSSSASTSSVLLSPPQPPNVRFRIVPAKTDELAVLTTGLFKNKVSLLPFKKPDVVEQPLAIAPEPVVVAPLERVDIIPDAAPTSKPPEDVDNDSLDDPLFEGINVGPDSPPEDPLSITPTLNTSVSPVEDPLQIETTVAVVEKDLQKVSSRSNSLISNSDDESDGAGVEKAKKVVGLAGYQLYRCAQCNLSFPNCAGFKRHLYDSILCKKVQPYKCTHCDKCLKTPLKLALHVQSHGELRFTCSLCGRKFAMLGLIKAHMKMRHNITNSSLVPLVPTMTDTETDSFVVRPVSAMQPTAGKESAVETAKTTEDEFTFTPDKIKEIPIRQIFPHNVKCGLCNYQTKVRVNIVRHLQMHENDNSVPDTAPVNPVPCLEKNEKMFDKMINLAASSFTERKQDKDKDDENIPEFVPTHCRFVCCAQGCSYLCPEEANLRHHLIALHSDETEFTCAHCKRKITPTDADSVIKHFKMHGLSLYKCKYCAFVHNLKHKVEKHVSDCHLDQPVKYVTVRAMDAEPNTDSTPQTPSAPKLKPWRCCMCKYKCANEDDVKSHIVNKHDIDSQFKCTLCRYKSNEKGSFDGHFKEQHPSHDIDIIFVYRKVEDEETKEESGTPFDTTPLWLRDRPRVRHIRGILFDESSPQPSASKSPKKVQKVSAKNLVGVIDAVARGTTENVIVIDDEEETDKGKDLLMEAVKMSDLDGVLDADDDEYDEMRLKDTFGDVGTPNNKQWKCPKCLQFKSKRIGDFIFHLYKDFNVFRYRCKACQDESITYKYMLQHIKVHWNNSPDIIETIPANPKLETWIQMVIREQSIRILENYQSSADKIPNETDKSNGIDCLFCDRKFDNIVASCKHTLEHWIVKPYACRHCPDKFYAQPQLRHHQTTAHPRKELFLEPSSPTVAQTIAICEENFKKRLSATNESDSKVEPPNDEVIKIDSDEELVVVSKIDECVPNEDEVYACAFCACVADTESAIVGHLSTVHDVTARKFKTLNKKNADNTQHMLACNVCDQVMTELKLRLHFLESHSENDTFSPYMYKCGLCSNRFLQLSSMKMHFSRSHVGKSFKYQTVASGNPKAKLKLYKCTLCSYCYTGQHASVIRSHVRTHVKAFRCETCQDKFKSMKDAETHHAKTHPDTVPYLVTIPEENKRFLDTMKLINKNAVALDKTRAVAKKSTSAATVSQISTIVTVDGIQMTMTLDQLSNFMNLNTYVDLSGCRVATAS